MRFLDDTLQARSTISNIPSAIVESEDSLILDHETAESQSEGGENETQVAPAPPQMAPPLLKRRKVGSHHDTSETVAVDKVIGYLQNKPSKREFDGIDHLFLSYADTFRKFQPTTQATMKIELATLFARTEMRELGIPQTSTFQPPLHSDNSSHSSTNITTWNSAASTSPVYQNIGSSTNDSYENARHLYENYGQDFQSDTSL